MNLPKRKRNRLEDYDYSSPNAYFITVCTAQRKNLFWENEGEILDCPQSVPLNETGKMVQNSIERIPDIYPQILLDHYVIMPNHVHLLLQICTDDGGRSMIAPTVSTVVRHMKGYVSKQLGVSIWQKGFYDHVIRNDADYQNTWVYIEGNPGKWNEDELYSL